MDSLTFLCFLSKINYSNILRIKIKSVYVKDFLISTKVRLKRVDHLHGEEPIFSEPTFSIKSHFVCNTYDYSDFFLSKIWSKQNPVHGNLDLVTLNLVKTSDSVTISQ